MKRKLIGILLSFSILFSLAPSSLADQVWGDAVDANVSNHDQSITLNINVGETWSTVVSVNVNKQGTAVSFPVSGSVSATSGVSIGSNWLVNGYDSSDRLTASKTESTAGQFSYTITFSASNNLEKLSKTSDSIHIVVNVADPASQATAAPAEPSSATAEPAAIATPAPALTVSAPAGITKEAEDILTNVNLGTATSNYPDAVFTNNAPAAFPLGSTVVVWTAERNGETATDSQVITIVDTTKPTISSPADITAEATAVLTPVSIGSAAASDIFLKSVSNDAPDAFPLGRTIVTWTAEDTSGNTSSATQSVMIVDTTPPALTVPQDKTFIVGETVNLGTAVAADIFLASVTNDAPSSFPIGTTLVTWTAKDTSNNVSTATQKITVKYAFGGILQPINRDGSSLFKSDSTVPVKFQLKDAFGNYVSNAAATLKYARISNGIAGTDIEAVSTASATSGNQFRYDSTSNQYIFNLSTKGLTSGTYRLTITLNDGMTYTVQISLK